MTTMTFYTNPQSRGRIVRWMLEEVGQPYDVHVMTFGGDIKSPEYLALNPMGKVPALVHNGTVITEVAAICTYLAEQFPQAGLAPAMDSPARGGYYRWLFFVAGPFEMANTARAFGWEITDDGAVSAGCGHVEDPLNTVRQTLAKQPYLCGDQFTTADLLMASYIGWETMTGLLQPDPLFAEYVERCHNREAARRADDLDNALIEKSAG
ncbi:glutathione S-transferase family protein [Isoalcanivorax indicus]|uniref:glutathione S-transferase family protein n=1 Tax=Isoalcanivorax indicus TaxID=2202653 RepID=UPI000DBA310E|nr:glutathione S-transferase family protein [Isoalcanivorax indicus]